MRSSWQPRAAKLLSPQALLARLEQRFDLLVGGPRDMPSRQQTLRATIDWSYGLLGPTEQTLLARLSVFAGGFTLEAAEAVCGADGLLAGLSSLIDNNLLRQDEQPGGEPRFTLLETIRAYALERLDELGEREEATRRHADYFCILAERFDREALALATVDWAGLRTGARQRPGRARVAGRLRRRRTNRRLAANFPFLRFGYLAESWGVVRAISARLTEVSKPARLRVLRVAAYLATSRGDQRRPADGGTRRCSSPESSATESTKGLLS